MTFTYNHDVDCDAIYYDSGEGYCECESGY